MDFEKINFAILIISFLILAIFIYRKIPALTALPVEDSAENAGDGFLGKTKNRIKNMPGVNSLSPDIVLQKVVSQARVLSLKADHKTADWLKTMRQKTQKKKLENGDYWEEIKNSKDLKK